MVDGMHDASCPPLPTRRSRPTREQSMRRSRSRETRSVNRIKNNGSRRSRSENPTQRSTREQQDAILHSRDARPSNRGRHNMISHDPDAHYDGAVEEWNRGMTHRPRRGTSLAPTAIPVARHDGVDGIEMKEVDDFGFPRSSDSDEDLFDEPWMRAPISYYNMRPLLPPEDESPPISPRQRSEDWIDLVATRNNTNPVPTRKKSSANAGIRTSTPRPPSGREMLPRKTSQRKITTPTTTALVPQKQKRDEGYGGICVDERLTVNNNGNGNGEGNEGTRTRCESAGETSFAVSESGTTATNTSSSSNRSLKEKLFGDRVLNRTEAPARYLPRTPLVSTVHHNERTNLWIATLNLNQKAENNGRHSYKNLRAFSYPTELEARESTLCNTPPKMIPFADSPNCFLCKGRFAIFRRASHCRNCGVCVCSNCSVPWRSVRIPETFNSKNEKKVNVCKSCNHLSDSFQDALRKGRYSEAMTAWNTGNLNLRCPFTKVNGDRMFPIHCASEGGNTSLLRWLVEQHCCPIRVIRTSNRTKPCTEPLLTAKGKSAVSIALARNRVDILQYLIVEKGMQVTEVKDIKLALGGLEAVLRALPTEGKPETQLAKRVETTGNYSEERREGGHSTSLLLELRDHIATHGIRNPETAVSVIEEEDDDDDDSDDATVTTVHDACIICYENSIDCVIAPCGHQMCCLECSANLSLCPVCNSPGNFIRIYRP